MSEQSELLRVSEVATKLGVGRSRAYELVADGTIPHVRVGPHGNIKVPRAAFDAWLRLLNMQAAAVTVDHREPADEPVVR